MTLYEAVKILETEKEIAKMELEAFPSNEHFKDFIEAVECVSRLVESLKGFYECVSQFNMFKVKTE